MQPRVEVFFYGLFMDEELLRSKGLDPHGVEPAHVEGLSLRIGRRATLVPDPTGCVHGRVMSITFEESERLYADPSVRDYRPLAVLTQRTSGKALPALCYVLPVAPGADEHNPEYAKKLRAVAESIGLPDEYIASIR